jgi:hypothetical protein
MSSCAARPSAINARRLVEAGPIQAEPNAKRPGDGGRAPFTSVSRSAPWLAGWLVIEVRIGCWTRKNWLRVAGGKALSVSTSVWLTAHL